MKFLIAESLIRSLIDSGKITAEDLGLETQEVFLPTMPDLPYHHCADPSARDPYLALPDIRHRVCSVVMISHKGGRVKMCKNSHVVYVAKGHKQTRYGLMNYNDALDICLERERKFHRGERRSLEKWLKARAAFNHVV